MAAERAERALRTTVGLLEPLLVVVLGIIVAATAAALLQAVYSVRPI
jgi:type II secretory pathway component PulF